MQDLVNNPVIIKLKWGQEYRGILVSTDSYMNVQLSAAQEYINNELAGPLGDIIIRCNNVLYIRGGDQTQQ